MGKKILLVEDDSEIACLLQDELTSRDYEVRLCDTGDEVLRTLHSFKPDLLIMDVMLPGIDGYSLTTHISEDGEFKQLPIIIMSALTTSKCMFESFPQVIAFFSKPFHTEDFVEAIRTAFEKKE